MPTYSLRYGRGELPLSVDDTADVTLIRKPTLPVLPDPDAAVQEALSEPVGCESLDALAQQAQSACIAICDITRPVPNHLFLRPPE